MRRCGRECGREVGSLQPRPILFALFFSLRGKRGPMKWGLGLLRREGEGFCAVLFQIATPNTFQLFFSTRDRHQQMPH